MAPVGAGRQAEIYAAEMRSKLGKGRGREARHRARPRLAGSRRWYGGKLGPSCTERGKPPRGSLLHELCNVEIPLDSWAREKKKAQWRPSWYVQPGRWEWALEEQGGARCCSEPPVCSTAGAAEGGSTGSRWPCRHSRDGHRLGARVQSVGTGHGATAVREPASRSTSIVWLGFWHVEQVARPCGSVFRATSKSRTPTTCRGGS